MSPATAGDVLRRTLAALGISQAELAHHAGLSAKHVNQIIGGHVGISAPVAVAIGEATGIPAEVWVMLDAVYSVRMVADSREPKAPLPVGLERACREACPSCGRNIRLRADGKIRRHGVTAARPDGCDATKEAT